VARSKFIQTKKTVTLSQVYKSSSIKEKVSENIAEETPIALIYNGISHVVMMGSPSDLEDFAVGFSITEGIVKELSEIYSIEIDLKDDGIELKIEISSECFLKLKEVRRNLTGRTGCGLCGAESLSQAMKIPKVKKSNPNFYSNYILKALKNFSNDQALQKKTGATHASALFSANGDLKIIREDVGRHIALDKLIGASLKCKNYEDDFVITSSRASYEMVQKIAYFNFKLLIAISAPTGLAIRMADNLGITLIGFAREARYTIYSHNERIIE
jgi:FdhD protein